MRISAPAKVNLGLRIVGRRPDGYHLLESVFAPLDLADELDVEATPAPGVTLGLAGEESAGVPSGPENLVHRAARGFCERAGLREGVRISLRKRIPAGAGLGGGSSDAGSTLRALARLFPERVDARALAELALTLGADVPFFLAPQPALVEGIGERVRPLRPFPSLLLVLAHPGTPLATADVYRAYDASPASLTPSEAGSTFERLAVLQEAAGHRDAAALAALLHNDLETAATGLCPPIARLREALREQGARAVGMSGSGPTVYGVFEEVEAARRAREALGRAGRAWLAATAAAE